MSGVSAKSSAGSVWATQPLRNARARIAATGALVPTMEQTRLTGGSELGRVVGKVPDLLLFVKLDDDGEGPLALRARTVS